jgi:hypothetical protein
MASGVLYEPEARTMPSGVLYDPEARTMSSGPAGVAIGPERGTA